MRIEAITSESGNDFSGTLICEHCGERLTITNGYHDNYYHTKVIPAMKCGKCGLRRCEPSPEEVTACVELLVKHRGEWVWYMTDEEYSIANAELERRKRERAESPEAELERMRAGGKS